MPKLIINDKSGRMDSSMDFFLDGKFITFKETKKESTDTFLEKPESENKY